MKKMLLFSLMLLCGCTATKVFYQTVLGDERVIGLSLPQTESLNVSAYQTFTGTKTTVKDRANIWHFYTETNSNSIFGCNWTTIKTQEIIVADTNVIFNIHK